MAGSTRDASRRADASDPDQDARGVADREFIGAPRLRVRRPGLDDQIAHALGDRVDVIDVQVQPERVVFHACRPARHAVQMQMPTAAVGEDAVVAVVADDREAQAFVKGLAGIKIGGGDDGGDMVLSHRELAIDPGWLDAGGGRAHLSNMTLEEFPRISVDAAVCGGRPVITGTRIRVSDILDMLASGESETAIVADYSYLTADDVRAALRYAAHMGNHPIVIAA